MKDFKIKNILKNEILRQKRVLRLIPSENYVSQEVKNAVGSDLLNKYSEGYPSKRYYQGNSFIDLLENKAIKRAKKLFNVPFANVQPYSGSIANAAVYFALLKYNDVLLGMDLKSGGHLTHGYKNITFSGKFFKSFSYSVNKQGYLDYEKIRDLALEHSPNLIISGASSYPRKIDFDRIGQIAKEVNAFHLADISHISGLIVGNQHQSPVEYADIITTTTHKTLRGPRGAMILVTEKGLKKDPQLGEKIDKAVFPGLQGGPHDNTTAGIAVALKEASTKEFIEYSAQIVKNSQALASALKKRNFDLVSGGTDNHLILLDVASTGLDAWLYAWALEYSGIIVNRNSIPFDTNPPYYPSGIRLGTPAITTIGLLEEDMEFIAEKLSAVRDILLDLLDSKDKLDKETRLYLKEKLSSDDTLKQIAQEVAKFVNSRFTKVDFC